MDALEFLKERKRMCESFGDKCTGCPALKVYKNEPYCAVGVESMLVNATDQIVTVEQWSKEHPRKTRQSVFLEQYPEARIGDDGVLQIYPCLISALHRDARGNCATMGRACSDCCREFWSQKVE